MIYILNQQDRVPISIQSNNLSCNIFSYILFACGAFFLQKNLARSAFFVIKKHWLWGI